MVSKTLAQKQETIGERLEATRRTTGLTQSDFCNILGIGRTSYSYYIRGEREVPVSVLAILFEKYSVDPFWMIYGEHSDQAMQRKSNALHEIREIGIAVENRAKDRGIELSADERWRIIAQVYTLSIVNDDRVDIGSNRGDFLIDNFMEARKSG